MTNSKETADKASQRRPLSWAWEERVRHVCQAGSDHEYSTKLRAGGVP